MIGQLPEHPGTGDLVGIGLDVQQGLPRFASRFVKRLDTGVEDPYRLVTLLDILCIDTYNHFVESYDGSPDEANRILDLMHEYNLAVLGNPSPADETPDITGDRDAVVAAQEFMKTHLEKNATALITGFSAEGDHNSFRKHMSSLSREVRARYQTLFELGLNYEQINTYVANYLDIREDEVSDVRNKHNVSCALNILTSFVEKQANLWQQAHRRHHEMLAMSEPTPGPEVGFFVVAVRMAVQKHQRVLTDLLGDDSEELATFSDKIRQAPPNTWLAKKLDTKVSEYREEVKRQQEEFIANPLPTPDPRCFSPVKTDQIGTPFSTADSDDEISTMDLEEEWASPLSLDELMSNGETASPPTADSDITASPSSSPFTPGRRPKRGHSEIEEPHTPKQGENESRQEHDAFQSPTNSEDNLDARHTKRRRYSPAIFVPQNLRQRLEELENERQSPSTPPPVNDENHPPSPAHDRTAEERRGERSALRRERWRARLSSPRTPDQSFHHYR